MRRALLPALLGLALAARAEATLMQRSGEGAGYTYCSDGPANNCP